MPTEVAEGEAVLTVNVGPFEVGMDKAAVAAERSAQRQIKADERAAERHAIMAEKAAERAMKAAEKEASKRIKEAERAARKEEAAAKQAAQLVQTNLGKVGQAAGALTAQIGGPFAKLGALANSSIKPVLEVANSLGAVGVAGLAVGAAALGFAAVAAGAVTLTNAAVEAEKRLIAAGHAAEIPRESRESLALYSAATSELRTNIDLLTVAVGAELAPGLTRASTLLVLATDDTGKFGTALDFASGKTRAAAESQSLLALAISKTYDIGGRFLDFAAKDIKAKQDDVLATNAMVAAEIKLAEAEEDRRKKSAAAADAAIRAREESFTVFTGPEKKDGGRDFAKEERDKATALRETEKATTAAAAADAKRYATKVKISQLDEKIETAMAAEKEGLYQSALAAKEFDRSLEDIARDAEFAGTYVQNMITEEAAKQQKDRIEQIRDAALGMAGAIADSVSSIFAEVGSRQVEAASQVMDANAELRDQQRTISQEILRLQKERDKATTTSARNAAQQRIDELVDQKEAKEQAIEDNAELAANRRKHAMQAFIGNKFAAVSGIGIQTALGIMNAMATVPWPAAPFVAAGVGVMGATQAGIALAQQPPEFPMGRSPDHAQIIAVQPGEPTLPRRAARDLGADTIRHLQEGRGGGGNVFVLEVDGREVAAMVSGRGRVKVDRRAGKSSHGRR